jgi:hypothetical protein
MNKQKSTLPKIFSLFFTFLILLVLLTTFTLALEGDTGDDTGGDTGDYDTGFDDSFDSDVNYNAEIDWSDSTTYSENFYSDPAAGFENNPDLAWETLNNDPSIFATNPDAVDSAFTNDPSKAANLLNDNPSLFKNTYTSSDGVETDNENANDIREQFRMAASGDSYTLLNDNPEARIAWLASSYEIEDTGSGVTAFDGDLMTTKGSESTMFSVSGLEDAKIEEDGSLTFARLYDIDTGELKGGNRISGGKISYSDESGELEISGNALVILAEGSTTDYFEIRTVADDSEDIPLFLIDTKQGQVQYSGSMIITNNEDPAGYKISSQEGSSFYRKFDGEYERAGEEKFLETSFVQVDGYLIEPTGSREEEFIIGGDTLIAIGGIISGSNEIFYMNLKNVGDDEIYYSENPSNDANNFCSNDVACITNTPRTIGVSPAARAEISIQNVPSEQIIAIDSVADLNSLQIYDVKGIVGYSELPKNNMVIINKGELSMNQPLQNTGKIDYYSKYPDACDGNSCTTTQHHWSSLESLGEENTGQDTDILFPAGSNRDYFDSARADNGINDGTTFVTCTQGLDCTERFASAYGKTILSEDGNEPKTIIIVSGDWPDTAAYLEEGHCQEAGCYIISNRDVPDQLPDSVENVIVTGHHYNGESRTFNEFGWDTLCFSDSSNEVCSSTLPHGTGVETISFSACHTVMPPDSSGEVYSGASDLVETYPNLEIISGRDATTEGYDLNWDEVPPSYKEKKYTYGKFLFVPRGYEATPEEEAKYKIKEDKSAVTKYELQDDGTWGFSYNGITYRDVNLPSKSTLDSETTEENIPLTVDSASEESADTSSTET